jgi:hypothetical protein
VVVIRDECALLPPSSSPNMRGGQVCNLTEETNVNRLWMGLNKHYLLLNYGTVSVLGSDREEVKIAG